MSVSQRLSRSRVLAGSVASVVVFFAIEGLVFRTPFLYRAVLDPEGSSGRANMMLGVELRRQKNGPQIIAVGDSRMGFVPHIATRLTPQPGYIFASIVVHGSNPRCWYYFLRHVDPNCQRYAAILIPVNDYDDMDPVDDFADHDADLRYLAPCLGLEDLFSFPASFRTARKRWLA
jgi:hypothetical protein